MPGTGKNQNYLRVSNLASAVRILAASGPVTRQTLADQLGLTRMSLTYIVNDLMEKGIAREVKHPQSGEHLHPGRKPVLIGLCSERLNALGINITPHDVHVSISNVMGENIAMLHRPVPQGADNQVLLELVARLAAQLQEAYPGVPLMGVGVASTGLIRSETGAIAKTKEMSGIRDLDLRAVLNRQFGLPVFVVNDMKAAALAEYLYGASKEYHNSVYLGISYGVGVGVITGGRLYVGSQGFSSEIGHTSIDRGGERCICGNVGCAELYTSVPNVLKRTEFDRWEDFLQAAESGNQPASRVLDQLCQDLGTVLVNIANLFDPQVIIIGHEGAQLGSQCFRQLQEILNSRAMARNINTIRVLPSVVRRNILSLGPAALVFSQMFTGKIQL